MNPELGSPGAADEEVLVVQRWPRWLPVLIGFVLAAVLGVFVVVHETGGSNTPVATPTTSSAAAPSPTVPRLTSAPPVAVTRLGHPLLGATSDELFGRGQGVVVRIELAQGRVTTTAVPMLDSSGPVSFVVTRHDAIVRPLDFVPGYEVPDGQASRPLSGPLRNVRSGPMFPGPDGNSVWAASDDTNAEVFREIALDGAGSSRVLRIPHGVSSVAGIADGSGYIAFAGGGGTWDSTPAGLRKVTTGSVIAIGPTRWLTRACAGDVCPISAVDPRTGAASPVVRSIGDSDVVPGVVSPNGSAACVIVLSPSPALVYLNLRTGTESVLALSLNMSTDPRQSLVWSSDSRYLFALDATGEVHVIDSRTLRITDFRALGPALPSLTQLAIR